MNRRLGVLISGRGSNLQALIDAVGDGRLHATIAVVISNRADAAGLARARQADIETLCIDHHDFRSRDEHDRAIARELQARDVALVCLAGYMRLVGAPLLDAFPSAIVNIHPSLLPAFPGLHTHRRALEAGCKVVGVTVHFVTPQLDHGPIVIQAAVPVRPGDDEHSLAERVLACEHLIYPRAVRWFVTDRLRLERGIVSQTDGEPQLLLGS